MSSPLRKKVKVVFGCVASAVLYVQFLHGREEIFTGHAASLVS